MSAPTHAQAARFIRETCLLYRCTGDPEDREMEGWAGYLEACLTYRAHAGRHTFWEHAFLCIREHLEALRRAEAQRQKLESPCPLEDAAGEGRPAVAAWYPACQGDFVNTLQLRDYLSRLPSAEKAVAWGYINREPDDEICACHGFTLAQLAAVRRRLAHHLQEYLAA